MLFSEQCWEFDSRKDDTVERCSLLSELLAAFQSSFPTIRYELFPELNLVNAQALLLRDQRVVRLYGGVALHPALGRDGLAFVLLHETGHHLAEGARYPWNPLIACECVADSWALRSGRVLLGNSVGWTLDVRKAAEEISSLYSSRTDITPCSSHAGVNDRRTCWAKSWHDRRESILTDRSIPFVHTCPLDDEVLGPRSTTIRNQ
ncbi:hypothetical protein ACVIHH_003722 [Bradyrhizobium sp. USDA 4518]